MYIRLLVFSSVEVLGGIPLTTVSIYYSIRDGVNPWISWENTHSNFSRVVQIPASLWRSYPRAVLGVEFPRWSTVGCAFVFFAIFASSNEALRNYRSIWRFICLPITFVTGSRFVGCAANNEGKSSPSAASTGIGPLQFAHTNTPKDTIASGTVTRNDTESDNGIFEAAKDEKDDSMHGIPPRTSQTEEIPGNDHTQHFLATAPNYLGLHEQDAATLKNNTDVIV